MKKKLYILLTLIPHRVRTQIFIYNLQINIKITSTSSLNVVHVFALLTSLIYSSDL